MFKIWLKNQKTKKTVFPVTNFGTYILPVANAMPKELLPIVDKPLIQYAEEKAIASGLDTFIFVAGRNKRDVCWGNSTCGAINKHAKQGFVETVRMNLQRFDCRSMNDD